MRDACLLGGHLVVTEVVEEAADGELLAHDVLSIVSGKILVLFIFDDFHVVLLLLPCGLVEDQVSWEVILVVPFDDKVLGQLAEVEDKGLARASGTHDCLPHCLLGLSHGGVAHLDVEGHLVNIKHGGRVVVETANVSVLVEDEEVFIVINRGLCTLLQLVHFECWDFCGAFHFDLRFKIVLINYKITQKICLNI